MRLSIHPSRVGIVVGSETGENLGGSGALLTSVMLVSMMFFSSRRAVYYGRAVGVDGGELE
jgi:hypothetical protein